FDDLEKRFDILENRFDNLEKRFDILENRFDILENRFNKLDADNRLEHLQLMQAIREIDNTKFEIRRVQ
ncbi:MAG TPA: hypothetical protein PLH87_12515, partial [Bacillota bacterium]|nr:hypothetical protein [Bacillota bacterium]